MKHASLLTVLMFAACTTAPVPDANVDALLEQYRSANWIRVGPGVCIVDRDGEIADRAVVALHRAAKTSCGR